MSGKRFYLEKVIIHLTHKTDIHKKHLPSPFMPDILWETGWAPGMVVKLGNTWHSTAHRQGILGILGIAEYSVPII